MLLLPDSAKRFYRKWQGPFKVKCQVGRVNYEIIMNSQGHNKIFHFNLLKKWYTRASEHVSLFSDTHEDGSITDRGNLT